jgi:hypothetical protein
VIFLEVLVLRIGLLSSPANECSDSGSLQGGAMRERSSQGIFGKHVMRGNACLVKGRRFVKYQRGLGNEASWYQRRGSNK